MTQTAFGITNLAKLATITATSSETAFPPEKTITDIGAASEAWQTVSGVTSASLVYTLAVPGSQVMAIGLFRTNLSPTAQITATVTYDAVDEWTDTAAGPVYGHGQVVFVLPAAEYADSVTIAISDPDNEDGHLNVPLVFIGNLWLPTYSFAPSLADGWEPVTDKRRSRGGQTYNTGLSNCRVMSFEFQAITESDSLVYARELARTEYLGVNVLVVPDTASENIKNEAIFGTVSSTRLFGVLPGASRMRTWAGQVREVW